MHHSHRTVGAADGALLNAAAASLMRRRPAQCSGDLIKATQVAGCRPAKVAPVLLNGVLALKKAIDLSVYGLFYGLRRYKTVKMSGQTSLYFSQLRMMQWLAGWQHRH